MTRLQITLLLSLTLTLGSCGESRPPGWFESETADLALVMPEEWSGVDIEEEGIVVLWKGDRSPQSPSISIVHVEPLPKESTMELFFDLNIKSARQSPGYLALRIDTVTFGERKLPALVYNFRDSSGWKQGMMTSTVVDDGEGAKHGFVVNTASANGRFEGDKEEFRRVLGAVELMP